MKAVGIILAGGKKSSMGDLASHRNVAAMPVGGAYRAVDFTLSNFSHSGIKKVALITQFNTRSLFDHISSSKWWNFGRKTSGLYIFTPHMLNSDSLSFRGTADSIFQNIAFLKKSNEPYVVITSAEQVVSIDYTDVIKYHEEKGSDITMVCKDLGEADVRDYGVVSLDHNSRMLEFEEKPLFPQQSTISLGTYVIGRQLLIDLLEEVHCEGRFDFVLDILVRYRKKLVVNAYMFEGYWRTIKDVPEFYKLNMDFLNADVRNEIFEANGPVYTKPKDDPPVKYSSTCHVTNSILNGGDIINGTVENSVIFRDVFVGEGAIVKNSVIMEGCTIGNGAVVENMILDKVVSVGEGQQLIGDPENIGVIAKRSIV
ncbi:MAG: glucose-1-phosphate adenylyltransferase subunit GlgD [Epulopiscium sp. Nele67-Bin005]|nr:MAG: glucose-1-phosphate adenylyltransferase subunit GlgD [Epulopiscium sp. Nele67-Bin005]